MYANNTKKFTAVLSKRQPVGTQFNALGHLVAGLMGRINNDCPEFLEYKAPHAGFVSMISTYPVIVLGADNNNQMRRLCATVVESGLPHNIFTTSMVGASAAEQVAATAAAAAETLEFVGVIVFGAADVIDPMTKRFSVLR